MEFPCNVSALLHAFYFNAGTPNAAKIFLCCDRESLDSWSGSSKAFVWGRLNQFKTSTYAARVRSLTSMIFGHGDWLQFKNHFWLIAIFFFC